MGWISASPPGGGSGGGGSGGGDAPGKKAATLVVGTSLSGHEAQEVDFLCDGTADDVEINAALAALPEGGGLVLVLEGEYSLADEVVLSKPGSALAGTGAATLLRRDFAPPVYNWGSPAIDAGYAPLVDVEADGCTVRDVAIDGKKQTYSYENYGAHCAVGVRGASGCVVARCRALDSPSGFILRNASSCVVSNCVSTTTSQTPTDVEAGCGVAIEAAAGGESRGNAVTGNTLDGHASGLGLMNEYDMNGDGGKIQGNVISGNLARAHPSHPQSGLLVFVQPGTEVSDNVISGNSFFGYMTGMNVFTPFTRNLVSGNLIARGGPYGQYEYAVSVYANDARDNLWTGNMLMDSEILIEAYDNDGYPIPGELGGNTVVGNKSE